MEAALVSRKWPCIPAESGLEQGVLSCFGWSGVPEHSVGAEEPTVDLQPESSQQGVGRCRGNVGSFWPLSEQLADLERGTDKG